MQMRCPVTSSVFKMEPKEDLLPPEDAPLTAGAWPSACWEGFRVLARLMCSGCGCMDAEVVRRSFCGQT